MSSLRIIYMGTAELACASLAAICHGPGMEVVAVVTQPDRPKGRDLRLTPSAVKELALREGLPVLQPERAREPGFIEALKALSPDLIVVTAYGQILPPALLAIPRLGCLNVHTSLLPKYRGAAPIQYAILDGEAQTGVTVMKMDAGLDTGDILTQTATPIGPEDNAQTLHDRLAQLGAELLARTIPEYAAGKVSPRPQVAEQASYARKITKEDGHLDWTQPALALWNRIRAFTPWPGAFTFLPAEGKRGVLLKVWSAQMEPRSGTPGQILQADKGGLIIACGQQSLKILELQRENARRMRPQDFLAGHALTVGQRVC
jgi:methionyl-tRNA formyltransferase